MEIKGVDVGPRAGGQRGGVKAVLEIDAIEGAAIRDAGAAIRDAGAPLFAAVCDVERRERGVRAVEERGADDRRQRAAPKPAEGAVG